MMTKIAGEMKMSSLAEQLEDAARALLREADEALRSGVQAREAEAASALITYKAVQAHIALLRGVRSCRCES